MLPIFVFAAPSITSVTISAGELNVAGINFGTNYGVTTPIFWDNFDSGTAGDTVVVQLAGSVPWTLESNKPKYDNTVKHSGNNSIKATMSNILGQWGMFNVGSAAISDPPIPDSLTYYQTFWFLTPPLPVGGTYGEEKVMRMFGNEPWEQELTDSPFVKTGCIGASWWSTTYNASRFDAIAESGGTWADAPARGVWHRIEGSYKQSSVGGASDGYVEVVVDGVSKKVHSNIITRTSSDYRYVRADFYNGTTNIDPGSLGLEWYKWLDDAYLGSTWQRVELCSGNTWLTRGHCEMQLATSWDESGTIIAAAFGQGSFADGANAYVYVVDENGDANTNGFGVTLPDALDIISPSAPQGLSVI